MCFFTGLKTLNSCLMSDDGKLIENKMSKYQYSKLVMEKFLRRSFYDAVLELYETDQGTRIISVSLEGNLSLVVNKDESFVIKLNEVAQRADDREEHQQRFKTIGEMKLEGAVSRYVVKKELPNISETNFSLGSEVINLDTIPKDGEKFPMELNPESEKIEFDDQKYKFADGVEDKLNDSKGEGDSFEKSSEGESDSEEEVDLDVNMAFQRHIGLSTDNPQASKMEVDTSVGEDICFLPVVQTSDFKRKYEFKEQEQLELLGKKSPRKSKKTATIELSEEGTKVEDREKAVISSTCSDDGSSGGPQLLPHTGNCFSQSCPSSLLFCLILFVFFLNLSSYS